MHTNVNSKCGSVENPIHLELFCDMEINSTRLDLVVYRIERLLQIAKHCCVIKI